MAVALLERGEWLVGQGRGNDAEPLLDEAQKIFERLRAAPWLERVSQARPLGDAELMRPRQGPYDETWFGPSGALQTDEAAGNRRFGLGCRATGGGSRWRVVRTVAWNLNSRGNNGNARRSLAFGQVFARRLIRLNHALWANSSELTRTPLRIDKLGVSGGLLVMCQGLWVTVRTTCAPTNVRASRRGGAQV